jgi:DNA-binding NtrC family response regulator
MEKKARILILDDRIDELSGLKALLEDEGYEVHMTASPFSLPFVVRSHNPDLILIDVNMPALSGERLLRSIPRKALKTTAPFVLFSGIDMHDLASLAKRTGADGCIYKGSDIETVLSQIKQFVAKRVAEAELRR